MERQSPRLSEAMDEPEKDVEILHQENFDVILQKESSLTQEEIEGLLSRIEEISNDHKTDKEMKAAWQQHSSKPGDCYWEYPKEEPRFFIKYKQNIEHDDSVDEDGLSSASAYHTRKRASRLLFGNILGEFKVAKHVKKALSSELVSNLARLQSRERVTLVEPMMGVIEKEKKRKFVIYEYHNFANEDSRKSIRSDFANSLQSMLRTYGVYATDLRMEQIKLEVGNDSEIFLIDTEAYRYFKKFDYSL